MAEDVVKSVGRVFEVVELFSATQQPLNATEVERRLNYPQSSTLALLKSLVKLGYLSFDRIERSYFPTIRIAHLGNWLETSLFGSTEINALMEDVSERTGQCVALSCQNDLRMQFLQIVPGRQAPRPSLKAGDTAPLFQSAIGIAALTPQLDADIARLVQRANRRTEQVAVVLPTIMERVTAARSAGHARWTHDCAAGLGAFAWPLASSDGQRSVVLSVAMPTEVVISEAELIVDVVNTAMRSHIS